jgi:FtsH-binding integral membrane protein
MKMNIDEYDKNDRVQFVRKVYTILATQLTITALFIIIVQTSSSFRDYMMRNIGLYIASSVLAMVSMCAIVCCFGRKVPINYILLAIFTVCEAYGIAGVTAQYDKTTVMMAGGATALTTISLTIYAMRTTTGVEVFAAMAFVVYLAMFPLIVISFFVGLGALNTLYCCLGVILYGLFLIIDTIMITGGKTMSNKACSMDDYVIGAMMLYMDIVMLFLYLLQLFGKK